MVRTNRRTTMMGLGALSLGSGAAFTAATLTDGVTPDGDFRVIADRRLRALPGPGFRGGTRSDAYDPDTDSGKYKGENIASNFFTTSGNNPLEDIAVSDLPVAGVNDASNGDLQIQVATEVGEVDDFDLLLQVENNSAEDATVGIQFSEFGEDVTGSDDKSTAIFAGDVMDIYSFYALDADADSTTSDIPNGNWTKISPDGTSTTTAGDPGDSQFTTNPTSPNYGTYKLPSGVTHVVGLQVDTDQDRIAGGGSTSGDSIAEHLEEVASSSVKSFQSGDALDDLDLVDVIRVGLDDGGS